MPVLIWLALSLFSGAILSFIQSPTDYWLLIFPCFSVFYYCFTKAQNKKQVFSLGFLFSLGYFVASLHWIGNALLVDGNDYKWAWPLAVIALPALLSLFTALYLTIFYILFKNKSLMGFVGFCLALFISEWARGHAFTGFPWNLYGYGWIGRLEVAQTAYWIGPYGLTFLTIFWGSVIGFCCTAQRYKIVLVIALITLLFSYFIGDQRLKNKTPQFNNDINIHIVQPNIPQEEKWLAEKAGLNFEKHTALSNVANSVRKNIIVWPETALSPLLLNSAAAQERIQNLLHPNTILLAGALEAEQNGRTVQYHNSLMMWHHGGVAERFYTKSHLVPFGEYIPFQKYIPLKPVAQFTGFERGRGSETITIAGFPSFTPKICYEIIFPHKMIVRGQPRPDFILTITNDGWYGKSAGPYQHFTQARFRAIENNIPVIRSANTGVSGIVDGYGRVVQKTNLMEAVKVTSPFLTY